MKKLHIFLCLNMVGAAYSCDSGREVQPLNSAQLYWEKIDSMPQNEGVIAKKELSDAEKYENIIALAYRDNSVIKSQELSSEELLFKVIKINQIENVKKLVFNGVNTNCYDYAGCTPLMRACNVGNDMMAAMFIEYGIDINAINPNNGYTALTYAAESGSLPLVSYLLKNKSDPNKADETKNTPLLLVSGWSQRLDILTLLLDHGAKVETISRGYTPLLWAWKRKNYEAVKILLDYQKDFNLSDYNGDTPLHWSASDSQDSIAEYLVSKGAAIDSINNNGDTPLHFACKYENVIIAKLLLEHGAEPTLRNNEEFNAFDYANESENKELIRLVNSYKITKSIRSKAAIPPLHDIEGLVGKMSELTSL